MTVVPCQPGAIFCHYGRNLAKQRQIANHYCRTGSVTLVPPERATDEIGEVRLRLPQQYSRRRRLRRAGSDGCGAGQMTAGIEGVVTDRVAGKETLRRAGRSKILHLSL